METLRRVLRPCDISGVCVRGMSTNVSDQGKQRCWVETDMCVWGEGGYERGPVGSLFFLVKAVGLL